MQLTTTMGVSSSSNGNSVPTPIPGQPDTTLTYLTTQTLPNGGPTATFLTTSVAPAGPGAPICLFNSANICQSDITTFYTTGFLGFTVLSSFSVEQFTTTTAGANGQVTAYLTSSTQTWTRAFSGVSHISLSTYVDTSSFTTTATAYLNSQLTTYTSTGVSIATTTSAAPLLTNAAPTLAAGVGLKQAAIAAAGAVAGAALVVL